MLPQFCRLLLVAVLFATEPALADDWRAPRPPASALRPIGCSG